MDFLKIDISDSVEAKASEIEADVRGEATIEGSRKDDNLSGGLGDNTLIALGGDDNLKGDIGDDRLFGNAGNDNLDGGIGDDLLDGLSGRDSLEGGVGNDELNGGTESDRLNGDIGDDLLDGDGGNDYLVGSLGEDTLLGGKGKDSFFFTRIESSSGETTVIVDGEVIDEDDEIRQDPVDLIDDFDASEDKIFIYADSFDVESGDKSTLKFDRQTKILSLADEPVFKITSGIGSEIIENTEVIQSDDSPLISENIADAI